MASLWRPANWFRRAWQPRVFPNANYPRLRAEDLIEEETLPGYLARRYYPTKIGEILQDRYQIVGKLGYGVTSTVWLARDMPNRRYVTLKLFIGSKSMGNQVDDETRIYDRIRTATRFHRGRSAVRSLLDSFDITGPYSQHRCLVHTPLWESVGVFLQRNPVHRLPKPVLAFTLRRLFEGLDYLHTECKVIHTDIKADNIVFEIEDEAVLQHFEDREVQDPSPRKEVDGRTIYLSRPIMRSGAGAPILCDFGSAVVDEGEHTEDIQPNAFRAPEVILGVPWTSAVDIWNVACMIWPIFEGGALFSGQDPEHKRYRSRTHLASNISLLGPPPPEMLARARDTNIFFTADGKLIAEEIIGKQPTTLEERETTLKGEDKTDFLRLMRRMLHWDPEKRSTAKELASDPWILKHVGN